METNDKATVKKATRFEDLERFEIVGGPSKFDFILALSYRKWPAQNVTFKVKGVDREEILEVEVKVIFKTRGADDTQNSEGDTWRLLAVMPSVVTDGHESLSFGDNLIGSYSTKTRTGLLKKINRVEESLIYAAFGYSSARDELKLEGYKLPGTPLL